MGKTKTHAPLRRGLLVLVGLLLLTDVVALLALRVFNVGVAAPALLGGAALFIAWRWESLAQRRRNSPLCAALWRGGWMAFVLWLVSLAFFFAAIQRNSFDEAAPTDDVRAIVILGSGSPNCAASPTLKARLERGREQARRWPSARIVVSGGRDFRGSACSEAQVMADYLAARGLPRNRMLLEENSTSTDTNLAFSRRLLEQHGIAPNTKMLLITSDFHLLRAERIAMKAGLVNMVGVAAPTPIYIRYNSWLREYFATFSSWVLGEF